jgi:hypothetical protein
MVTASGSAAPSAARRAGDAARRAGDTAPGTLGRDTADWIAEAECEAGLRRGDSPSISSICMHVCLYG